MKQEPTAPENILPAKFRSVCVFCGSASGTQNAFVEAARTLGRALAKRDLALVYGGGRVGLMGALADASLDAGGKVIGVMPQALVEREIAHTGLTQLLTVNSMHERKTRMSELASAFIVLPGGPGTLEEAFEQWTWAQLAIHTKPIGFLDVPVDMSDRTGERDSYFAPLLAMVDRMVEYGFLAPAYRDMLIVERDATALLDVFERYEPPPRKTYEQIQVNGSPRIPLP